MKKGTLTVAFMHTSALTACADPGIFVRGSRPDGQKTAWTKFFSIFLVLNLFYSLQKGSNGLLQRKLYFSKDPEGVQHFRGGGGGGGPASSGGGGGPNAYFYRTPYNL